MLWSKQRGQIFVFYALLLPVLLMFGSMMINVGIVVLKSARLQNAADAAALAMASAYNKSSSELDKDTRLADAKNAAKTAVAKNLKKNTYTFDEDNSKILPTDAESTEPEIAQVVLTESIYFYVLPFDGGGQSLEAVSKVRLSDLNFAK